MKTYVVAIEREWIKPIGKEKLPFQYKRIIKDNEIGNLNDLKLENWLCSVSLMKFAFTKKNERNELLPWQQKTLKNDPFFTAISFIYQKYQ